MAQDLAAAGFGEAGTVHSALFRLKNGRAAWDQRTVLVVDEAAMLDARITGEVLSAARDAGAKVILAGDDRQLTAIERGGLFSEMRERHGAAEITEVTRQRVGWQRQAARDLAEGRFAAAVEAFDAARAITWTGNQDEARDATKQEVMHMDKAGAYWQRRLKQHRHAGGQRWKEVGAVQRFAHRHGLRPDTEMARSEAEVRRASRMVEKTGVKRAALRDRLAYEERVAETAFEKVRPAAEAELAMRQEQGREARTVLGTQREQEIERERTLGWEHEWSLSRGRDR